MKRIDVAIIGGGQAGLAMSHNLSEAGMDHLVFERRRIAERWRTESWDSLRLLTPTGLNDLPGWTWSGHDRDSYLSARDVATGLQAYARRIGAPTLEGAEIQSLSEAAGGYLLRTSRGSWHARSVVVATGACDQPIVPGMAANLPASLRQIVPRDYRNPGALPPGGVLVVGASASGVQIALELAEAGREVTLSVGRHVRVPRLYRGHDILWWMDWSGLLDETWREVPDLRAARRQPSLQLVGHPDRRTVDLGTLRAAGVRLAGRTQGVQDGVVQFADDLAHTTAQAERRLRRLLDRIERYVAHPEAPDPDEVPPLALPAGVTRLDLAAEGVGSVIWATGYRRTYPWLRLPVLDADGEITHDGGVTALPGLVVLGLPFLRRRSSTFLGGVGRDAGELALHVLDHLSWRRRAA